MLMSVGTPAKFKWPEPSILLDPTADIQVFLRNTFHPAVLPGREHVDALCGLHKSMKLAVQNSDGFGRFPDASSVAFFALHGGGHSVSESLDDVELHLTPEKNIGVQNENQR